MFFSRRRAFGGVFLTAFVLSFGYHGLVFPNRIDFLKSSEVNLSLKPLTPYQPRRTEATDSSATSPRRVPPLVFAAPAALYLARSRRFSCDFHPCSAQVRDFILEVRNIRALLTFRV